MAEDETEELAFYEDGTPLNFRSYQPYDTKPTPDELAFLALRDKVQARLAAGEPVYCQIMDDRRAGSVGRISKITFDYVPSRPPTPGNYSHWNRGTGAYTKISDIEVVWDGRKNKVKPWPHEVELLLDWDKATGTIWEWTQTTKEPVEKVKAFDHLGQEIEPGQNVCFVHRKYGRIDMMFGTVTRITDKGGVFIKRLKLRDTDRVDEYRALDMDDVIIVNESLMSRLVMARLAAQ